ncbi:hypothetical protein HELRODRAFT_180249 [Helobdella robusta]|uniref:Uncharacterized protein n=1 Tax=Helobdella robusta TaxID=6412 RepID=T1FFM7_HELRO|nr:hypothetical protein HELRODRAFT_180249 [Helobdella robusta]ESN94081.1 hypothetical protein HELRODRAFT_180249 [Helobdella robusta]
MAICLAIFQIHDRFALYLQYPTSTEIDIVSFNNMTFPQVTICNNNYIKLSSAQHLGLVEYFKQFMPPFQLDVIASRAQLKIQPPSYENQSELVQARRFLSSGSDELHYWMWNRETCSSESVELRFTDAEKNKMYVNKPGAEMGLLLVLVANRSDYFIQSSFSSGYRILLHEPGEPPQMQEHGFMVNLGEEVNVALSATKTIRQPAPYGTCRDLPDYDQTGCELKCLAEIIIKNCGCRPIHMEEIGNESICDYFEENSCVVTVIGDYYVGKLNDTILCSCPPMCNEINYETSITGSRFSRYIFDVIKKRMAENETQEDFQENAVVVRIYFSSLQYTKITTVVAYSVMALLSDLGGTFGLLLGSTFLTLVEVFELLWDLFLYVLLKKKMKKETVVSKKKNHKHIKPEQFLTRRPFKGKIVLNEALTAKSLRTYGIDRCCDSMSSSHQDDIQTVASKSDDAKMFVNVSQADENNQAKIPIPSSADYDKKKLVSIDCDKGKFVLFKEFKISKMWKHRSSANEDNEEHLFLIKAELIKSIDEISIIGVKQCGDSNRSILNRVMWFIFILFGITLAMYQVNDRLMYYLTYPTSTEYDIVPFDNILPQVTVCNNNFIKKSSAESLGLVEYFKTLEDGEHDFFNKTGSIEERKFLSPGLEQMCSWNALPCYNETIDTTFTNAGQCIIFDPRKKKFDNITGPGARMGLQLILFVNQSDYLIQKGFTLGFNVMVHEPEDPPHVLDLGFKINVGKETNVVVSVTSITRLKPPHGNCKDQLGYNQVTCKLRCLVREVVNNCGCRPIYLKGIGNESICDYHDEIHCVDNLYTDLHKDSVTSSKFSNINLPSIKKFFDKKSLEFNQSDISVLRVFPSSMQHTKISCVKAYSESALLSDLGGALGFLLGSTFLTVFEVFELVWNLCLYAYARKKYRQEFELCRIVFFIVIKQLLVLIIV